VEADICREEDYVSRIGKPDAIVHLAFPTPLCTRDLANQFYQTASIGTANLLGLALKSGAYFIYGSSISVYGVQEYLPIDERHPTFPMLLYGANKLHGENLCRVFGETYGLEYVILRYSDLYGPRDKRINAINNFLTATLTNQSVALRGGGKQRRTYTFVADAALATLLTIDVRPSGQVLNVACNQSISIAELVMAIKQHFNPGLMVQDHPSEQDGRDYVFDNTKFSVAVGKTGWTPLQEGLRQTLAHISASRQSDSR
jgi:UDP-glucose 4-epimerase